MTKAITEMSIQFITLFFPFKSSIPLFMKKQAVDKMMPTKAQPMSKEIISSVRSKGKAIAKK